MIYSALISIPIIIGVICIMFFSLPIKRNSDSIVIGYPFLKKTYNIHQYEFKLRLTQIYKYGHKKTNSGAVLFHERTFYRIFESNKVLIYIWKKQSTGAPILIRSHLIDIGLTKKNSLKAFQKIINVFPKETSHSIAEYYD